MLAKFVWKHIYFNEDERQAKQNKKIHIFDMMNKIALFGGINKPNKSEFS